MFKLSKEILFLAFMNLPLFHFSGCACGSIGIYVDNEKNKM